MKETMCIEWSRDFSLKLKTFLKAKRKIMTKQSRFLIDIELNPKINMHIYFI